MTVRVGRERVKLYIGKTGRGGGGTRGEWADSVVPYMHIRRKLVEQKVAQPRGV